LEAGPGDHFEVTASVPVTILRPYFNWLFLAVNILTKGKLLKADRMYLTKAAS
jgi:hypothetical protein